jgi:hypothetical protein
MTNRVEDFAPTLRRAIAEAKAAGFGEAAAELEERAFACYTTSSELLGETGAAIRAFLNSQTRPIPDSITKKLELCLKEIRKVWPRL